MAEMRVSRPLLLLLLRLLLPLFPIQHSADNMQSTHVDANANALAAQSSRKKKKRKTSESASSSGGAATVVAAVSVSEEEKGATASPTQRWQKREKAKTRSRMLKDDEDGDSEEAATPDRSDSSGSATAAAHASSKAKRLTRGPQTSSVAAAADAPIVSADDDVHVNSRSKSGAPPAKRRRVHPQAEQTAAAVTSSSSSSTVASRTILSLHTVERQLIMHYLDRTSAMRFALTCKRVYTDAQHPFALKHQRTLVLKCTNSMSGCRQSTLLPHFPHLLLRIDDHRVLQRCGGLQERMQQPPAGLQGFELQMSSPIQLVLCSQLKDILTRSNFNYSAAMKHLSIVYANPTRPHARVAADRSVGALLSQCPKLAAAPRHRRRMDDRFSACASDRKFRAPHTFATVA